MDHWDSSVTSRDFFDLFQPDGKRLKERGSNWTVTVDGQNGINWTIASTVGEILGDTVSRIRIVGKGSWKEREVEMF